MQRPACYVQSAACKHATQPPFSPAAMATYIQKKIANHVSDTTLNHCVPILQHLTYPALDSPNLPVLLATSTSTSCVSPMPMAKYLHINTNSSVPMATVLYRQLHWRHPLKKRLSSSIVLKQTQFSKMFVKVILFGQFISLLV